jgi:hypothetical protein
MKQTIFVIYIGLAVLHIFLVKNIMFLVLLVILFEVVRLLAVWHKIKLIVVILALFSSIFIIANYYNAYSVNQSNNLAIEKINNNINSYVNKYWVNQDTFKTLIGKQEENIKNTNILPSFYLVATLVILIELSLAYMVCLQSIKTPVKIDEPTILQKPIKEKATEYTIKNTVKLKTKPRIKKNIPTMNSLFDMVNGQYFYDTKEYKIE